MPFYEIQLISQSFGLKNHQETIMNHSVVGIIIDYLLILKILKIFRFTSSVRASPRDDMTNMVNVSLTIIRVNNRTEV